MTKVKDSDFVYRYAEALLIVFKECTDKNTSAIKFNHKDLYELIKGEDAGRVYVNKDLIDKISNVKDNKTKHKLLDEMDTVNNKRLKKVEEVLKFMERVSDALTLTELCDKYGRELVITEYEREIWVAVDLKAINIKTIDF